MDNAKIDLLIQKWNPHFTDISKGNWIGTIAREKMEDKYAEKWNKLFAKRLKTGRMLQRLFDSQMLTTLTIRLGRSFPSLIRTLIKQTHGEPF